VLLIRGTCIPIQRGNVRRKRGGGRGGGERESLGERENKGVNAHTHTKGPG
jgi:hypothetical protein